jgi:predicted DNA-binding antitoxin AbrB/MazE fold protein
MNEFNEFNDFFKVGEVGVLKPLKSVILDRGKGELLGLNISINGRIGKADRSKGIK